MVEMVGQQCEYTWCHRTSHLKMVKMVNWIFWVFYHKHTQKSSYHFYETTNLYIYIFLKVLLIFREKGTKKEREWNINVWLPLTRPLLGTWPTAQACALTGNRTGWPLGSQAGTQSTEPHQSGPKSIFLIQPPKHSIVLSKYVTSLISMI